MITNDIQLVDVYNFIIEDKGYMDSRFIFVPKVEITIITYVLIIQFKTFLTYGCVLEIYLVPSKQYKSY